MLPTNLMDSAAFRGALGITEDQFTTAGMCGMLPRALGVINGGPVWAEQDVRSFALANGYTFNSSGEVSPHGTNSVVVVPPHGADTVAITNNTGEVVRVHIRDVPHVMFGDPATEVGATTHGKLPTDKSGKVRILRDTLQPATIEALRRLDLSSSATYAFKDLPAAIQTRVPTGVRTAAPVINEAAKREQYTTVQLCDYLGMDDTTLYRLVKKVGIRARMAKEPSGFGTNHHRIYSHAQATKIRNSPEYKKVRRKSGSDAGIRDTTHKWLIAFLGEESHDDAHKGQELAPHRTPVAEGGTAREATPAAPVVEVIPPDVWLTEAAAADHLGWPLDVLRIARKERTGPLSVFRTNQIMYRVADLDAWKMANTTLHDAMKHVGDEELDEFQAAQFVGLTVTTLRNLRNKPVNPRARNVLRSPAFRRVGRHGTPMYWRNDLSAWMVHNARAIDARRSMAADPARLAAVTKAREKLAANRAARAKGAGKGEAKARDMAQSAQPQGDKVAAALVAQANARKPVSLAVDNALTNGRATFANKVDAHIANSGKVGKKTVVKASRTLAGGRVHH